MPGTFSQEEISQALFDLYNRIKKLERELRVKQQVEELEAAEPASEVSGAAYPWYQYYTVRVSSTDASAGCFLGQILVPTASSSKWTAHNTLTAVITVDVPEGLDMPEANAIVGAFFTGPYAVGMARFALFGAGGGKVEQSKVVSVFSDYLTCISIRSGTSTGTYFAVAKPYKLRRAPFHGQTINGITWTYSTDGSRLATDSSLSQTEIIVPRYTEGSDLIYIINADHTEIADGSGEEITKIDANVDGRAWATGE